MDADRAERGDRVSASQGTWHSRHSNFGDGRSGATLMAALARIERQLSDIQQGQMAMSDSLSDIHSSMQLGGSLGPASTRLSPMGQSPLVPILKQAQFAPASTSEVSGTQHHFSMASSGPYVDTVASNLSEQSSGFVASTLPSGWPASLNLHEALRTSRTASRKSSLLPWLSARTRMVLQKSEEDSERNKRSWLVIHPDSTLHAVLDMMATMFVVYELLVTPYAVAWHVETTGWLLITYWFSAAFWSLDMLLGFVTGFYENGSVQLRPGAIRYHYVFGWFIADFALVAADLASLVAQALEGEGGGHGLRLLRLSRIFRVVSIAKASRLFLRLEDIFPTHHAEMLAIFLKLTRIAVAVLGANHLLACFWMVIGRDGFSDTGRRWVDQPAFPVGSIDGPFDEVAYLDLEPVYQYSVTFHWALTQITLGSTQVGAYNSLEMMFSIACLTVGLLMGTTLISMFSAEMVEAQVMTRQRDVMTKQLIRFLRQHGVERRLSLNVRAMVNERLKRVPPLAKHEVQSLALLPSNLALELHFEICGPTVLSHPVFALWHSLSRNMVTRLCMDSVSIGYRRQNDDLFRGGDIAEKVYYLKSGHGIYEQVPESAPVTEEVLEEVDQPCWLAEAALWVQWVHVGTFKLTALGVSEVLALPVRGVISLLTQNVVLQDVTVEYCRLFHARLCKAAPPRSDYPNDLSIPRSSFPEILFDMDLPTIQAIAQSALNLVRKQQMMHPLSTFAGSSNWWAEVLEEFQKGHSVLYMAGKDSIRCVSFRAMMQITNNDNMVLLHAGDMTGVGKYSVVGSLPGSKQERGESPEAAIRRVMAQQLAILNLNVEASLAIRTQSWARISKRSSSWCIETVFHTKLNHFEMLPMDRDSVHDPGVSFGHMRSRMSQGSWRVPPPVRYSVSTSANWLRQSVAGPIIQALGSSNTANSGSNKNGSSDGASSGATNLARNPIFVLKHKPATDTQEATYGMYMWVAESDLEYYKTDVGRYALEHLLSAQDFNEVTTFADRRSSRLRLSTSSELSPSHSHRPQAEMEVLLSPAGTTGPGDQSLRTTDIENPIPLSPTCQALSQSSEGNTLEGEHNLLESGGRDDRQAEAQAMPLHSDMSSSVVANGNCLVVSELEL